MLHNSELNNYNLKQQIKYLLFQFLVTTFKPISVRRDEFDLRIVMGVIL